jgi:flagellar L-ring protein precursor FlgH
MKRKIVMTRKNLLTHAVLTGLILSLTACNAMTRLNELGDAPALSSVATPQAIPVSFPVPTPEAHQKQPNSLWQTGARAFFKDQRAGKVGDILTVKIVVSDKANLKNETKRSRDTEESDDLSNAMGLGNLAKKVLPYPSSIDTSKMLGITGKTTNNGKGEINRTDDISTRVAAVVTQVLPNGNLVIYGKQEMVVNYELREIKVAGVIRPEDISSQNSINYDQIAEARITYGGRGEVMDVQQARYGSQLLDIVYPF